jgi:hypothetical protein
LLLFVNKVEQFLDVDTFVLSSGRQNLMINLLEILLDFVRTKGFFLVNNGLLVKELQGHVLVGFVFLYTEDHAD